MVKTSSVHWCTATSVLNVAYAATNKCGKCLVQEVENSARPKKWLPPRWRSSANREAALLGDSTMSNSSVWTKRSSFAQAHEAATL